MQLTSINQLHVGSKFKITQIDNIDDLKRRLMSLGISLGNELELLHSRDGGIVVGKQGNRVALGEGITQHLTIEVIE